MYGSDRARATALWQVAGYSMRKAYRPAQRVRETDRQTYRKTQRETDTHREVIHRNADPALTILTHGKCQSELSL